MEPSTTPTTEPWEYYMFRDVLTLMNAAWNRGEKDYRWHHLMQQNHRLHPVVELMLVKHRPINPEKLALEWPYISEKDQMRLAYTRNEADGRDDRQLVTSIGKYVSRHWSHIADHVRRDVASLYTPDKMFFVHTVKEMITNMELGPRSCMHSAYGSIKFNTSENEKMRYWLADSSNPEPDWDKHPYSSYLPEFGWHMAFRKHGTTGKVDGRVVCLTSGEQKLYVRTYARGRTEDSSSETDTALAAWLDAQGYTRVGAWPYDTRLSCPTDYDDVPQAPYLDGHHREIECVKGNHIYEISSQGDWRCDNTNGTADRVRPDDDDDDEDWSTCECCDERYSDDDMYTVGRLEDTAVCGGCRGNDYTLVRATARVQWGETHDYARYYVRNDSCACVIGHNYEVDIHHIPNNVIELESGDCAEVDDTVCIDDAYYMESDPEVVHLDEVRSNGDTYALRGDTWTCEETDNVYHDEVECVMVDGKMYHPDDEPDVDGEDDDEDILDLPPNAPIPSAVVEAAFPAPAIATETLPATAQPGWPFAPTTLHPATSDARFALAA